MFKPIHSLSPAITRQYLNKIIDNLSISLLVVMLVKRLTFWMMSSLFWPVGTNMGDAAFRVASLERSNDIWQWWLGGYRIIAEMFTVLPYEYRTSGLHILDDILIICFIILLARFSKYKLGIIWPSFIGSFYLITEISKVHFGNLMDRDWYGGWLAIVSILIIYMSNTRLTRVVSLVAWSFSIQFRPQAILFLPCLILIMLKRYKSINVGSETKLLKLISQTLCELCLSFAIANVPIIYFNGFLAYYSSMYAFLVKGGHSGIKIESIVRIKNIVLMLLQIENYHYPFYLTVILNAVALSFCFIFKMVSRSKLLITMTYLHMVCIIWAIVNPDINEYHLFPLFLVTSVIITLSVNILSEVFRESVQIRAVFIVLLLLTFAPLRPYYAPFKSIRSNLHKIKNHDYTPEFHAFWKEDSLPRQEWNMTSLQWRDLNNFINEELAASNLPYEIIQLRFRSKIDHLFLQFPLSNPLIFQDIASFEAFLVGKHQVGVEYYNLTLSRFINSLSQVKAGYIIWIPSEFQDPLLSSSETELVLKVINESYEYYMSFGDIQIWKCIGSP